MEARHTPVMVAQVLDGLQVGPGGMYVDCTVGEGGHALAVLEAGGPECRLLGIDLDVAALSVAAGRLEAHRGRVELAHGNFAEFERLVGEHGFVPADGALLDLGVSALQLETAERGFGFSREGPIDMRFDANQKVTAHELVNGRTERELADLIYEFGEEPKARRVARAIVQARPMETTTELAKVVSRAVGRPGRRGLHPATRTFQGIRIAVNRELDNLRTGLEQALKVLRPGGRLTAISYHSLEDRIVKRYFQREASSCICSPDTPRCVCGHEATIRVISRKVVRPSPDEVRANPRARSARMRVAQLL